MELRQLEYLVAVAEEANFTRAAERVHISQSGVSAQIKQLENDLGATLIDRSGRRATLTPAGHAALGHARAALASVDAVRRAVDDINGLVRGRITLGMVTGCTIAPLFGALASFRAAFPGVEVSLVEANSSDLLEGVRSGGTDLALVAVAAAPPDDLDAVVIVSEPIVAAVPAGHPLARRRRIRLADLAAHPLLCLPSGTGIRTVLDDAGDAAGTVLDIVLQASAPGAVADLAVRGLGVAVLARSMVEADDRLHAVAIDDVTTPAVLALVWRRGDDPAVTHLVAHCREAFGR